MRQGLPFWSLWARHPQSSQEERWLVVLKDAKGLMLLLGEDIVW